MRPNPIPVPKKVWLRWNEHRDERGAGWDFYAADKLPQPQSESLPKDLYYRGEKLLECEVIGWRKSE